MPTQLTKCSLVLWSWHLPTCHHTSRSGSHLATARTGICTRGQLSTESSPASGRLTVRACSDTAAAWICCRHTGVCPGLFHGSKRVCVGGDYPGATTHSILRISLCETDRSRREDVIDSVSRPGCLNNVCCVLLNQSVLWCGLEQGVGGSWRLWLGAQDVVLVGKRIFQEVEHRKPSVLCHCASVKDIFFYFPALGRK